MTEWTGDDDMDECMSSLVEVIARFGTASGADIPNGGYVRWNGDITAYLWPSVTLQPYTTPVFAMLSNPPQPGAMQSRQRQHRRQISTPTGFEAVKIAPLPNFSQQRQPISHRRGVSLDTRQQQFIPTTPTSSSARQEYLAARHEFNPLAISSPVVPTTPQQILRENQRQGISRPGTSGTDRSDTSSNHSYQSFHDSDAFLVSPNVTPNNQRFVDALASPAPMVEMSPLPYEAYLNSIGMTKNQAAFANNNNIDVGGGFDFYSQDSALSTPTFLTFPDSSPASTGQGGWISEGETAPPQSRRNSRRISSGIVDKVAKFENMMNVGGNADLSGQHRPVTPSSQFAGGELFDINQWAAGVDADADRYGAESYPPTPTETQHKRNEPTPQQSQIPSRFRDDYDESMEETLKPVRGNKHNNRNSGIFQELRQQAEQATIAQTPPPRANTMPMSFGMQQGLTTPEFMNMRSMNAEFVKIEHNFDGFNFGMGSMPPQMAGLPVTAPGNNPNDLCHPILNPSQLADDGQKTLGPSSQQQQHPLTAASLSRHSSPHSSLSHQHRRTESIASLASAASIASINIEETKTDTGVTLEDISQYIQGPDPSDGKWVCLYESCNKRFGRKENIKSHVQTHLNDRQYQCPSCHKCFVRQHDLKRHAKIHTGIKPYPCECGNSFARHDALTRHRQRGMCIGAFDGIVRKVVKRGRPRKNREGEEGGEDRRAKKEKARKGKKGEDGEEMSSTSSQSGYSESCSSVGSPRVGYEEDFPDILDVAMTGGGGRGRGGSGTATMNPGSLSLGPGVSNARMPQVRPLYQAGQQQQGTVMEEQVRSPSAMSNYSHASSHVSAGRRRAGTDIGEEHHRPHQRSGSPAKSTASYHTPPELSSSSSPPPTGTSGRFFEDGDNNHPGGGQQQAVSTGVCMPGFVSLDNDMLLGFGGAAGQEHGLVVPVQLDHVPASVGMHHPGLMSTLGGKFDPEGEYEQMSMFEGMNHGMGVGGDVFFTGN
ncbi:putative transcriptional factor [Triangularia setosa]|uniref:C2H2 type master regulator of conidiophore development brlA n=1 Tax=Triangularia setosa TaxID=2587417 RepID=A0AAN6W466_9PEZI|nr:putative transcriptional factor [Podospora setosa]